METGPVRISEWIDILIDDDHRFPVRLRRRGRTYFVRSIRVHSGYFELMGDVRGRSGNLILKKDRYGNSCLRLGDAQLPFEVEKEIRRCMQELNEREQSRRTESLQLAHAS